MLNNRSALEQLPPIWVSPPFSTIFRMAEIWVSENSRALIHLVNAEALKGLVESSAP